MACCPGQGQGWGALMPFHRKRCWATPTPSHATHLLLATCVGSSCKEMVFQRTSQETACYTFQGIGERSSWTGCLWTVSGQLGSHREGILGLVLWL